MTPDHAIQAGANHIVVGRHHHSGRRSPRRRAKALRAMCATPITAQPTSTAPTDIHQREKTEHSPCRRGYVIAHATVTDPEKWGPVRRQVQDRTRQVRRRADRARRLSARSWKATAPSATSCSSSRATRQRSAMRRAPNTPKPRPSAKAQARSTSPSSKAFDHPTRPSFRTAHPILSFGGFIPRTQSTACSSLHLEERGGTWMAGIKPAMTKQGSMRLLSECPTFPPAPSAPHGARRS